MFMDYYWKKSKSIYLSFKDNYNGNKMMMIGEGGGKKKKDEKKEKKRW